jgi:hypothetical protein
VEQLERSLEHELGYCPADNEGRIVENPLVVMQMMVACASEYLHIHLSYEREKPQAPPLTRSPTVLLGVSGQCVHGSRDCEISHGHRDLYPSIRGLCGDAWEW